MADYEQNVSYQGADDVLALDEALKAVWSEKPAVRAAFVTFGAFQVVNLAAFKAEAASTGKRYRELIGTFSIIETP
jgi:hypothetical protein